MRIRELLWRYVWLFLFVFTANGYFMADRMPWLWVPLVLGILAVNLFAGFTDRTILRKRWKFLSHGAECLTLFCISLTVSVAYHAAAIALFPYQGRVLLISAIVCALAHTILFWNGILCVYFTSTQLGVKWRVIGAVCGMIIPLNLICLGVILRIVWRELRSETEKDRLNAERQSQALCATKYPILFVHGVYFRDSRILDYWGRIPNELKMNGATVFYGKHSSAASVKDSSKELASRIRFLVEHFQCEKVNIIAHSKGGLDCRRAILFEGMAPYVASLTTVNTPHRGSYFADYLLEKAPLSLQNKVEAIYNKAANLLGDDDPDFMAAARDLTAATCEKTDKEWVMPEGIFCQSVGSVMGHRKSGQFPLNICYNTVKDIDGENDGLVAEPSFAFGERYMLLRPTGRQGISHADVIDLNRRNIPEFDVREFYVELVHDLKERGL